MPVPVRSLLVLTLCGASLAAADLRERLSFDPGWRFHLGDIPFPEIKGHGATYGYCKAGNAVGAAASTYDDSDWRILDLPHDWAVEGPFDPNANISQGYRPRGMGWYRKRFILPEADRGKHLELAFEGISTHATVWVNGTVAQRSYCGYTGFTIDLTPLAHFGKESNIVSVQVDAVEQQGWWYEGAGIYRHTWLTKRAPLHLATDGVFAQPLPATAGEWTIPVEAALENSGKNDAMATVTAVVIDPSGKEIAKADGSVAVPALGEAVARFSIPVHEAQRWSIEKPVLYRVRTTVTSGDATSDSVETTCGFRTIRFDPDKGFFLNDQPVKIKGTCNHQDHAGVGTVIPESLWAFRVRRLKELGSNAYRCSHNPPAEALLDECDRQGLLVMDEHRDFNVSPEHQRQLEWLVRRDRNHPSVILWSVFNEESMQGTESGYEMVRRMAAVVKRLDRTRPVTAAMSGGHTSPINVSQAVDVVGFNYNQNVYDGFHAKHPTQPMTSSEDTSAFMIRGEFETDKKHNLIGSYDDQRAPWGATHRGAWKAIATRPFVAGGFVWTGFDYRGEPTPLSWPSAGSFFGIMDQCGFPKTAYYIHQAQWITDRPILKIAPHWNWAGKEGKPIHVLVMSNADTLRLNLNGQDLGEQKVDPFEMNTWQVPYAPGKLEAIALKDGQEVARDAVETTGAPAALRVIPDRSELRGDGLDAIPVTVEVVDAAGRVVPTAGPLVTFTVAGPAAIIGLGNGDPNCHEAEKGDRHSLFNGLGQVILQTRAGSNGPLTLTASADGLVAATTTLAINPAAAPAAVAAVTPVLDLAKWKMSPVSATALDPNLVVADSDQNTWNHVTPGTIQTFKGGTTALYRTSFKPFSAQATHGGSIHFSGITGAAEVWLDGKQVATKPAGTGALVAPLPAGAVNHVLTVVISVAAIGDQAGFSDTVTVE
jgi:beta-galactosidase